MKRRADYEHHLVHLFDGASTWDLINASAQQHAEAFLRTLKDRVKDCVPLTDTRWVTALVTCEVCGYDWVAVYPILCERLECSKCGHFTTSPIPTQ